MTTSRSKSLPFADKWGMYLPFAEALNNALQQLSDIQVDGLPKFMSHVAFVPFNKGVDSHRDLYGYSLKPDIALMSIRGACEFYELDQLHAPNVSQLVSKIAGKSPSGSTNWNSILSAIELERETDVSGWASLPEAFGQQDRQVSALQDADQQLDETSDDSRPTTRKIRLLSQDHMLKELDSGLIRDLDVLEAVRGCGRDGSRGRDLRQQAAARAGLDRGSHTDPRSPE